MIYLILLFIRPAIFIIARVSNWFLGIVALLYGISGAVMIFENDTYAKMGWILILVGLLIFALIPLMEKLEIGYYSLIDLLRRNLFPTKYQHYDYEFSDENYGYQYEQNSYGQDSFNEQSNYHNYSDSTGSKDNSGLTEKQKKAMATFMFDSMDGVTIEKLQKQRRILIKAFHPDLNGENSENIQYAQKINEAFDILKEMLP